MMLHPMQWLQIIVILIKTMLWAWGLTANDEALYSGSSTCTQERKIRYACYLCVDRSFPIPLVRECSFYNDWIQINLSNALSKNIGRNAKHGLLPLSSGRKITLTFYSLFASRKNVLSSPTKSFSNRHDIHAGASESNTPLHFRQLKLLRLIN